MWKIFCSEEWKWKEWQLLFSLQQQYNELDFRITVSIEVLFIDIAIKAYCICVAEILYCAAVIWVTRFKKSSCRSWNWGSWHIERFLKFLKIEDRRKCGLEKVAKEHFFSVFPKQNGRTLDTILRNIDLYRILEELR